MKVLISLFLLLALASCASQKDKQNIQMKAANETADKEGKQLGMTIHDLIESSTILNEAQKTDLKTIIAANKKKADELTEESFKFRSLLVKTLLSGKINKKEVGLIKKNIKKIEAAKLKNTFDTVEKITKIVSDQPESQKFTEPLLNMERSYYR